MKYTIKNKINLFLVNEFYSKWKLLDNELIINKKTFASENANKYLYFQLASNNFSDKKLVIHKHAAVALFIKHGDLTLKNPGLWAVLLKHFGQLIQLYKTVPRSKKEHIFYFIKAKCSTLTAWGYPGFYFDIFSMKY